MLRKTFFACVIITAIYLQGCMADYDVRMVNVDPTGWERQNNAQIPFPNNDTVSPQNISIIVRFNETFHPQDIDLSIGVTAPDSTYFSEKFTIHPQTLPKVKNKHSQIEIPYRNNAKLNQNGDYLFSIHHDNGSIRGINAIGISIRQQH